MSQSVRPGNRERGWNDPPEFLHTEDNSTTQAVPNKRTILNQRVAHTFDTTTTANSNPTSQDTKPLTAPPLFIPGNLPPSDATLNKDEAKSSSIPTTPNSANKNAPPNPLSGDISVEYIESALNASVQSIKNGNVSGKVCDDITKRIKIFVGNWPRLNENVKFKMHHMAKALESKELQTANDLHLRLMMDYPAEVSQWMVGIKRLIHELITLNGAEEKPEASASSIVNPITCPLGAASVTATTDSSISSVPSETTISAPPSSVQDL